MENEKYSKTEKRLKKKFNSKIKTSSKLEKNIKTESFDYEKKKNEKIQKMKNHKKIGKEVEKFLQHDLLRSIMCSPSFYPSASYQYNYLLCLWSPSCTRHVKWGGGR